jgi:hypothetical protein
MIWQMVASGSKIFAATWDGVYMSADNGLTWVRRNSGILRSNINSIAISGNTIFATSYADGVYVSINDGITWKSCNEGTDVRNIRYIIIKDGDVIASASSNGILRRPLTDFNKLDVSTNSLHLNKLANSTANFDILSNIPWTITSSEEWLKVSTEGGSGSSTITLTAEANNSVSIRTATITVSANSFPDHFITANQLGVTTGVNDTELSELKVYPNPATDNLTISFYL